MGTKFGEFLDLTKKGNHACQVCFQNIHWFFQAERWKGIFPLESKRLPHWLVQL